MSLDDREGKIGTTATYLLLLPKVFKFSIVEFKNQVG
jgi:hypothetical protein